MKCENCGEYINAVVVSEYNELSELHQIVRAERDSLKAQLERAKQFAFECGCFPTSEPGNFAECVWETLVIEGKGV